MAALADWLKKETEEYPRRTGAEALRQFGPYAWEAGPALLMAGSTQNENAGPDAEALGLLGRFDPPPVESLAALLVDHSSELGTRYAAIEHLAALGPRARTALPAIRAVLREKENPDGYALPSLPMTAARAILEIDPVGGPVVVMPTLLDLTKGSSFQRRWAIGLLGQCGATAQPLAPGLLASLEPEDFADYYAVGGLTSLLGPRDGALLPMLRRQWTGKGDDPETLAEVLLRVGCREESLATAVRCLESDYQPRRVWAARWLGKHGGDVVAVEGALKRALAKASGAERVRLALALRHLRHPKETGPRAQAFAALAAILGVGEGEMPRVGSVSVGMWVSGSLGDGIDEGIGAAAGAIHDRLAAGADPVAALGVLLQDKDPFVRLTAAVALAHVEPRHPGPVPTLGRLLARYPYFFPYAADTLAELGPAAAPLTSQLLPLLRHRSADVSRAATVVLRRIDPALAARGWGAAGVPGAVPADLGPLWHDLAGSDALRADRAVWRLAGAGPRAVALVRERLRPPPVLTSKEVARLIADLDSSDFTTRQRASAELTAAIESAAPALRHPRAARPSLEVRRRIDALLPALDPMRHPEQRRRLRVVRLLAEMDTADARTLLARFARGDRRLALTREAQAALRRP